MLNNFFNFIRRNKLLSVFLCLIICFVIISIYSSSTPNYEVLYKDLSLEEAGRIVEQLNEKNIKWRYDGAEKAILVPTNIKDTLEIELK